MKLMIVVIVLLAASFADGRRRCPRRCPSVNYPVCDSDGNRYNNGCEMRKAACSQNRHIIQATCPGSNIQTGRSTSRSSQSRFSGWCPRRCPASSRPICDKEGKRYRNHCYLKMESCRIKQVIVPQHCTAIPSPKPPANSWCPRACPSYYKPVCGSDNKKYNNYCYLKMKACRLNRIIYPQSCSTERPATKSPSERCHDIRCPRQKSEICGNNGGRYRNYCELKKAACIAGQEIEWQTCTDCHIACTKELRKVCASDGKTYNNQCLVTVAACISKETITVVHQGQCTA